MAYSVILQAFMYYPGGYNNFLDVKYKFMVLFSWIGFGKALLFLATISTCMLSERSQHDIQFRYRCRFLFMRHLTNSHSPMPSLEVSPILALHSLSLRFEAPTIHLSSSLAYICFSIPFFALDTTQLGLGPELPLQNLKHPNSHHGRPF